MMMASFSLANAVHERTRIQAAADSVAFTTATIEARAFNTVAFMNRAIAGAMVAEMGIHAWHSLAKHNVNMYQAGAMAFVIVGITELAQCPKFNIPHCIHAFQAWRIAAKYTREYRSKKSDLQGKEQKFKDAVTKYSEAIKKTYDAQKETLKNAKDAIDGPGMLVKNIAQITAPKAQILKVDMNAKGFACAVEGSDFDDECEVGGWKQKGTVKSVDERIKVMESAAMAVRNQWEKGTILERSASADGYRGQNPIGMPVLNPSNMMDIQGNEGTYMELGAPNSASVSNNSISSQSGAGFVLVTWKHGVGVGVVASGRPPSTSNEYKGIPCDGNDGCFINFRLAEEGGETDWGQPATYGAVKQGLRKMGAKSADGKGGPWELGEKGEVKMPGTDAKFKYVPNGDGYAVAKGKAYFHQLGSWAAPPNLFDPFWRAKLHPFVREEMKEALKAAGDPNGPDMLTGQTPVEGVK
ncbi:MAG: hypothetical protein DI536_23660 [Archangium gephyra]|uniref:Uncharacterized protein n=1 Tax=Archangium gephyra TaxID=48 RepID=A0A2W5T0Q0_9BACT|nr:MAG: hypothetical protein DI536_23660 [Archangium gephyra]